MTAFDRFDPFERRISDAIHEIAEAHRSDYLDDILQQTAASKQRPRWTFLERWLPVDTTLARGPVVGRFSMRPIVVLLLLTAIVAGAIAAYVGSRPRLPSPFGPAANGQLVFGMDGDLYAVDSLTGDPRPLVVAEGEQSGVAMSPDGQLIAYDNVTNGLDYVWVANADGSGARQVMDQPYSGVSFAWAPDSRSMALVTDTTLLGNQLLIAAADGSGARTVTIEDIRPWDVVWDPQRPGVLLVRGENRLTSAVDLYFVDLDGAILSTVDLLQGQMIDGTEYEFSGLALSPDGSTIAYNSVEAVEPPVGRFRAHVINRDGTNDRPIPAPVETRYSQGWPIFSPDGKWIVMESWLTQPDDTAINQLALAPADGSAPAHGIGPSVPGQSLIKIWSPDGTRIIMAVADQNEVYAINPVTGIGERLPWAADLPDWQRVAP